MIQFVCDSDVIIIIKKGQWGVEMLFGYYSLSVLGGCVRMCNLSSESCNIFAVIFSFSGSRHSL